MHLLKCLYSGEKENQTNRILEKEKVLEILEEYNKYRRGEIEKIKYEPFEIGVAIDTAVMLLKYS